MKITSLIAPALILISGLSAFAQAAAPPAATAAPPTGPQKIAVVDMQQALIATKDGQKAVADLRAKYSPKDQEMQRRQQELQQKQEQYRKTQNTISDEAKAKMERDIDTISRGLQRDLDDAKQDMDQDQQRLLQELGGKMMQVLTKYASDNRISMVFDVSGQPNNLLFASTAIDITREVIGLYDKAAAVTPSAPPTTSSAPRTPVSPTSAPATARKPAGAATTSPQE